MSHSRKNPLILVAAIALSALPAAAELLPLGSGVAGSDGCGTITFNRNSELAPSAFEEMLRGAELGDEVTVVDSHTIRGRSSVEFCGAEPGTDVTLELPKEHAAVLVGETSPAAARWDYHEDLPDLPGDEN